jgi:uncharacterized membrane protein YhhN
MKAFKYAFLLMMLAVGINLTSLMPSALGAKMMCSGIFLVFGLVYYLKNRQSGTFGKLMLISLAAGFVGDYVITVNFLGGMICFIVDHLLLIAAFLKLAKFTRKDIVIPTVISVPLIAFTFLFDRVGSMHLPVMVYTLIIATMLSKAWTASEVKQLPELVRNLLPVGAVLFLISDFLLAIKTFSDFGSIVGKLGITSFDPAAPELISTATYFFAQIIFASLIYYINGDKHGTTVDTTA